MTRISGSDCNCCHRRASHLKVQPAWDLAVASFQPFFSHRNQMNLSFVEIQRKKYAVSSAKKPVLIVSFTIRCACLVLNDSFVGWRRSFRPHSCSVTTREWYTRSFNRQAIIAEARRTRCWNPSRKQISLSYRHTGLTVLYSRARLSFTKYSEPYLMSSAVASQPITGNLGCTISSITKSRPR